MCDMTRWWLEWKLVKGKVLLQMANKFECIIHLKWMDNMQ